MPNLTIRYPYGKYVTSRSPGDRTPRRRASRVSWHLSSQLLEELVELLLDHVVKPLGELLDLLGEGRSTLDDLTGDDLEVVLDGLLQLGDGPADALLLGTGLGGVASGLEDGRVVGAAAAVPGEEVGGVLGDVAEGTDGGDAEKVGLELLGGDGSDRVLGSLGGLEGEVVGQETADMGGGHRGTRDGVGGILAADPGGEDAQARGEDVSALAVVGEVGTAVVEGRSANGDGLLSSGGGRVAGVGVVVASSYGEVDTSGDGGVDNIVQGAGLATTEGHVGDGATEALSLASLGGLDLLDVRLGSPLNALDDIGHASRAVGAKDLDGVDLGLLGDAVLLTGDGARAVGAVAVAVDILVTRGNGSAPRGTALEVDVVDVGASVNDIGIDTLTTLGGVEVLVECAEGKRVAVGDTGKTPGCALLGLAVARLSLSLLLVVHGVDDRILLDVLDLFGDVVLAKGGFLRNAGRGRWE